MGNYAETKEEIKNHLFARVPLVIIHSSERERIERMFKEITGEMRIPIYYYTDVKQVVALQGDGKKNVDRDPLAFAQDLFRRSRNSTFVIGDARRLESDNAFSREVLDTLYLAMETLGTLVLVTSDYVWNRLARFGLQTALEYPDLYEREALIKKFIQRYTGKYTIEWEDEDINRASMLLRGFTEVQIDNIMVSQFVKQKGLKKKDLLELTRQKSRLYASVPCVEEVRIQPDLEVSGLKNMRKWVRERKQLFFIDDDILEEYDLQAPKGVLLVGIPGCGKSYSAKMIASEWELPLFRFDMGSIYDKWMGESEKKMKDSLTFLDNMSPCVVWIDEIEKVLSVSDSGNDTGKRIMGQFLYWLQESTGRVFLVATANDITLLPSELFRKGRFSEIFFIDLPSRSERLEVITQYVHRCLHREFSEEEMERLVDESEGFSYSDIESVIKEATQFFLLHPEEQLDIEKISHFFKQNISFSSTNPETVEKLRKWGKERALSAT